jgi:hypothetical protein
MAALAKQSDDIPQRLTPVAGFRLGEIDGFVASGGFEVSRKTFGLRGMGDDPRAETDGGGKNETLVTGSVFPHEMNATGRAENARFGGVEAAILLPERQSLK